MLRAIITLALASLAIAAFASNLLLARAALSDGTIEAGAYSTIRLAAGALILFACVKSTIVVAGYGRGEALSLLGWMGLALAITGLVVLLAPGGEAVAPGAALTMAIAGIAWGAYTLIGRGGGDAIGRTARNFLIATPLDLPMP